MVRPASGLFVGLATFDSVYRVAALPEPNRKVTALGQELAAGGPAANAAVAFAGLGGRATLITALGRHLFARYVADELAGRGVTVVDATPDASAPPAVSSIAVVDGSGERSVISVNAEGVRAQPIPELAAAVRGAQVLLVDGHHPELALAAARVARDAGVPVVLDAGSWKPVLDALLPMVEVAVCSADFRTPVTADADAAAAALIRRGVPAVAVTHGAEPVRWWSGADSGQVPVERAAVRDTLGAGDAFHGAFAFVLAAAPTVPFPLALRFAGRVATLRCSVPGQRAWLEHPALAGILATLPASTDRAGPG